MKDLYEVDYDYVDDLGDKYIAVKYKGEVYMLFNDEGNIHYPEDFTWGRMIGDIFHKGVELGRLIEKDKKNE